MSSDKIYLSVEEQIYLMEMLEINDANRAVEKFATILTEERADPTQMKKYLSKILKKIK